MRGCGPGIRAGVLWRNLSGLASPSSVVARKQANQYLLQWCVDLHRKILLQGMSAVGTAEDLCFEGALQARLGRREQPLYSPSSLRMPPCVFASWQ